MKRIKDIVFLIILLSLCTQNLSPISQRQKQKESTLCNTEVSPAPRAPPADSSEYSVWIEGHTNSVVLNGKEVVTTPDTTFKRNTVRVIGEGNHVTIIQDDRKSEVSIFQQGKNNKINISQK